MKGYKYHALGNDYLVMDPADGVLKPSKEETIRICHRHFGIGSDGILYGPEPSDSGAFKLTILNPDGSEAEKSGNGLRIFARYLYDTNQVREQIPFQVETLGGMVECVVLQGGRLVTVEMGTVSFDSQTIPVVGEPREVINETFEIEGEGLTYCAATVGNPHCVFLREEPSKEEACRLGPIVEKDRRFPNRTNVQFMKVLDRNNIQIEIWERGAGYTLASGSSSSASAAVARKLGLCDEDISVHMPGGMLAIKVKDDFSITMTGPVTRVADVRLSPEGLSDRPES